MLIIMLIFIIVGLLVGVLAGLFGFGGGLIVVPAVATFITIYKPEFIANNMHIAIATSLFAMVFTSLTTTYIHYRAKNILWKIAFKLKCGLVVGTIFGAAITSYLSSGFLRILFILFLIYTIIKLGLKLFSTTKHKFLKNKDEEIEPATRVLYTYGLITGCIAVLLGIGGSVIIVPFLRQYNYTLTKAAAIATAITPFLALFGAISYIIIGYNAVDIPEYCLGFIYIPAALGIIIGAFVGSSIGVKLAGKIPQQVQNWFYLGFISLILFIMIF